MSTVADDKQFIVEQAFLIHVIGRRGIAHGAADHQVDVAMTQRNQQLAVRRLAHFHRCAGMFLRESRQQVGQEYGTRHRQRTDADAAAAMLACSDFVQPGAQLGQHQTHEAYEATGQIGRSHGATGPHQQLRTQRVLQLAHSTVHGRLR